MDKFVEFTRFDDGQKFIIPKDIILYVGLNTDPNASEDEKRLVELCISTDIGDSVLLKETYDEVRNMLLSSTVAKNTTVASKQVKDPTFHNEGGDDYKTNRKSKLTNFIDTLPPF